MRAVSLVFVDASIAGCGFVVFPPNGDSDGGATSSTTGSPLPPDGPASSVGVSAAYSSSSGAGGSTGFGDCTNLPPCGSSAEESLTLDGNPPQMPQAIVRATLVHGKGGPAAAMQLTACFVQIGDVVDHYPTITLGSTPAGVGPSTDATCILDPDTGSTFYGSTPNQPVSVVVTSLGDVDGIIEGTFDALVSDGTTTLPLKGSFKACREPDLFAP